mgnify:CR=1 FL=1
MGILAMMEAEEISAQRISWPPINPEIFTVIGVTLDRPKIKAKMNSLVKP